MSTLVALRAIVHRHPITSITLSGLATTVAYASWLEKETERREKSQHFLLETANTPTPLSPSISSPMAVVKLPRRYNRDAIGEYWTARPVSVICRVGEIVGELTPLFLAYARDFHVIPMLLHNNNNNDNTKELAKKKEEDYNDRLAQQHASRLRHVLTRLGPAFIKMGQQLSIRPDLVPNVVLQELQKLCDSVQPVPDTVAMQVLQHELGFTSLDELNTTFVDIHRVASASLGQVYKATLRETGQVVAIKVQRPDMERKLSLDLFLLQTYGNCMDTVMSVLTKQIPYHGNFMSNFAQGSYMELDYENEAANQVFFKHQLQQRNCKVTVPDVLQQYTSRRVITSEWIDGIKLVDAPRHVIRKLIPIGVELFLTQLLDIGVFHADPHPANLYVLHKTGELCLLDFGLVAEVDEASRRAMVSAMVNLLSGDFDALIGQDAKQLGFLPHDLDVTELKPILTKILTQGLLESGSNLHMRKRKLIDISNELNQVFFQYPFSVPPFFALITRGLGLLEGIALSGDADFDIFQASYPYARKRALELFGYKHTGSLLLQNVLQQHQTTRTTTTTTTTV